MVFIYCYIIVLNIKLFISLPNIDKILTIFSLLSKLPYLSTLSTLLPPPAPSITLPSKVPKNAYFSALSRTPFKIPKIPPNFPPNHTLSNRPKQKESPKIKDSYYFPAYPDQFLPNTILLNPGLTSTSYKLSCNSRLFV